MTTIEAILPCGARQTTAVDGATYEYSARMIDAASDVGESDSCTITLLLPPPDPQSGL